MKTLSRNKRKMYYRNPTTSTKETDSYGNETGCYITTFGSWTELYANYSAGTNAINLKEYGLAPDSSRQVVFETGKCPLTETSQIYIGDDTPTSTTSPNYYVSGIIDSANTIVVTIKEVDVS